MEDSTLKAMRRIVLQAGARVMKYFGRLKDSDVRKKGAIDLVTIADTGTEEFIRGELGRRFPGSGFLGEESGAEGGEKKRIFVLDPIDGTNNFVHSLPAFCISLACCDDGEITSGIIYAPVDRRIYTAVKGKGAFLNGRRISVSGIAELQDAIAVTGFACIRSGIKPDNVPVFDRVVYKVGGVRRTGSAALDLCAVAEGTMEAFWELNLNAWDVMAGILLVREAGGRVTDYQGGEDPVSARQLCATNGVIHETFLRLIRGDES